MEKQYFTANYNEIVANSIYPLGNTVYQFKNSENIDISLENLIQKYQVSSIIDYGSGEGKATEHLTIPVFNYDPFVEQFKTYPETSADMVICYNSLNWIEDQYFNLMVDDLYQLTNKVLICNIKIPSFYRRNLDYYVQKLTRKFKFVDDGEVKKAIIKDLKWQQYLSKNLNPPFQTPNFKSSYSIFLELTKV